MAVKAIPRKAPKPTVLRGFFASLNEKTKGVFLLTLNMEANTELPACVDKVKDHFPPFMGDSKAHRLVVGYSSWIRLGALPRESRLRTNAKGSN